MASIISPLGLDNGVIHFGIRHWQKNKARLSNVIVQSIVISTGFGLLIGLVIFMTSPLLSSIFNKPELSELFKWFAIGFPLITGMKVATAATRITQKMRFTIIVEELSQPLLNLTLIIVLYFLGLGIVGFINAAIVSFGFAFALGLIYIRRLFSPTLKDVTQTIIRKSWDLLKFSLPTAFSGMFAALVLIIDRVLIGVYRPEAEAGIYQAISLISVLFITILSAFKTIVSPLIADLGQQTSDRLGLDSMVRTSIRWGLFVSLPINILIWFSAPEIITILFGPEYIPGVAPLIILSFAYLVNLLSGSVDHFLIMTGHQTTWLRISALMFLVNVIGNLILIPSMGMIGAALIMLATFSGISLLGLFSIKRLLKIWPYDRETIKVLVAGGATVVAMLLLSKSAISSEIISLMLKAITCGGVFALSLVFLGLHRDDLKLISLIRQNYE
jgi:O-antigen/teichoic acid export membrane protein